MKNPTLQDQTCINSLKLIGDFWTLRIIDALRGGELRYCELQRLIGNLNPVTLTDRLKKLEQAGLVSRAEATEDKIAVAYALTELGHKALPVINAIDRFAKAATAV